MKTLSVNEFSESENEKEFIEEEFNEEEFTYLNLDLDELRYDFNRIIGSIQQRAFKESVDFKKWVLEPTTANPVEQKLYTELFFAQQEQRFPLPLKPLNDLPLVPPPLNTRTSAEDIEVSEKKIKNEVATLIDLTASSFQKIPGRFNLEDLLGNNTLDGVVSNSQVQNLRSNAVSSTRIRVKDLRKIPKETDMQEAFPDLNILNRLFGLAWESKYYEEAWYFWAYQLGLRYQIWTATHPLKLILMISLDKTFRRKFRELWQNILPRLKQEWNIPDVPYLCKKWTPGIRFLTIAVFVLPFTYSSRRTYWLSPGKQGFVAQEEAIDWQTFHFREAASMLEEVKKADLWPNKWAMELSPEWHIRQEQTYSASFLAEEDWKEIPLGTSKELTSYRVQARLPSPIPESGIHIEKSFNLYPEELDLYLDELPRKLASHANDHKTPSQEKTQNGLWTSRDWEEKFPFSHSLAKVRYYAVPTKELGFAEINEELTNPNSFEAMLQKGTVQNFRELRHNLLLEYLEYRGAMLGEDPLSGQMHVEAATLYQQRRTIDFFMRHRAIFEEDEYRYLHQDLKNISRNKQKLLRTFVRGPAHWSKKRAKLFRRTAKPKRRRDYTKTLKWRLERKNLLKSKKLLETHEIDDLGRIRRLNPYHKRGVLYKEFRDWQERAIPKDRNIQELLFRNNSEAGQLFSHYYQLGTNRFTAWTNQNSKLVLFEPRLKNKYSVQDRIPIQQIDLTDDENFTLASYSSEITQDPMFPLEEQDATLSGPRMYPRTPMRYKFLDKDFLSLPIEEREIVRADWIVEQDFPVQYNESLYKESLRYQTETETDPEIQLAPNTFKKIKKLFFPPKNPLAQVIHKPMQDLEMTSLTRAKFNFLKAYVKTILQTNKEINQPGRLERLITFQKHSDVHVMGRTFGTNTRRLRRRPTFRKQRRAVRLSAAAEKRLGRVNKFMRVTGLGRILRLGRAPMPEIFPDHRELSNSKNLIGTYQVPVQIFQPGHLIIPDSFHKARQKLIEFWDLSPEAQAQLGLYELNLLDQEASSPTEILAQMRHTVRVLSQPIHSLEESTLNLFDENLSDKGQAIPLIEAKNWWDSATSTNAEVSKDVFGWVTGANHQETQHATLENYHGILPRRMSGHQYPALIQSRIKELLVSRYWFRNSFPLKRIVRVSWQLFPNSPLKTTLKNILPNPLDDTRDNSIQSVIHTELTNSLQRLWAKEPACKQQVQMSVSNLCSLDNYKDWLIGQALIQPISSAPSSRINENNRLLPGSTKNIQLTKVRHWQDAFFVDDVLMPLGRKPRKQVSQSVLKEISTQALEGKYLTSQRNLLRYRQMMLQRLLGTVRLVTRYQEARDIFQDTILPQITPHTKTLPSAGDSLDLVVQTIGTFEELLSELTTQITFLQDWLQQCDAILAKPSAFQLQEDFKKLHPYKVSSKLNRRFLEEERYRAIPKQASWRNPKFLRSLYVRESITKGVNFSKLTKKQFNKQYLSKSAQLHFLKIADSQKDSADQILLKSRKKYLEILAQWNNKAKPAFVQGNERVHFRDSSEATIIASAKMSHKRLEDQLLDQLAKRLPAHTFQAYGLRLTSALLSHMLLETQNDSKLVASFQMTPEANPDLSWLLKKLDELNFDNPSEETFETLWAQLKDVSKATDNNDNALNLPEFLKSDNIPYLGKGNIAPSPPLSQPPMQLGLEYAGGTKASVERHLDDLTGTLEVQTHEDRWEDLSQLEELVDQFHTHTVSTLGLFERISDEDQSRQFDEVLINQFPDVSDAMSRSPAQHRLWERWSLQSSSFLRQAYGMDKSLGELEVHKTGMKGPVLESNRLLSRTGRPTFLSQPDWYGLMGSPGITPIVNWHTTNYDRHSQWVDVLNEPSRSWRVSRYDIFIKFLLPLIEQLRDKEPKDKEPKDLDTIETTRLFREMAQNATFALDPPSKNQGADHSQLSYVGLDLKQMHNRVSLVYNKINEASEVLNFDQTYRRRVSDEVPDDNFSPLTQLSNSKNSNDSYKLLPPSVRAILIGRRTNLPRSGPEIRKYDANKTLIRIPHTLYDHSRGQHYDGRRKREFRQVIEPMSLYVEPWTRFSKKARRKVDQLPRKKVVRIVQKTDLTQYPTILEPKGFGRSISLKALNRLGWCLKLNSPEYKEIKPRSSIALKNYKDVLDESVKGIVPAPEERAKQTKPSVGVLEQLLRNKPWREWGMGSVVPISLLGAREMMPTNPIVFQDEKPGLFEVCQNTIQVLNGRVLNHLGFYIETFLDAADPDRYDRLRETRLKICESVRTDPSYMLTLDSDLEPLDMLDWYRQRDTETNLKPGEKFLLERARNAEQHMMFDEEHEKSPLSINQDARQKIGSIVSAKRLAKEFHYFYLMRLSMLEPTVWVGADKRAYYRMWPHELEVQIESLILAIYTTEQFAFMGLQVAFLLAKEIATLKNILGAVGWSTLVLLGLLDPELVGSRKRQRDRFRVRVYRTKKRLAQMSGVDRHMMVSEDALIYLQLHQTGFRLLGLHQRFFESHYIPKGFIMGGPPGTGKTFFAQAFAGDAKVPIVTVGPTDLVHSRVGVVLTRLRGTFATAHQQAPCVLFLDEMEAVGRQRVGMPKSGLGELMTGSRPALWAAEENAFQGTLYKQRATTRIGQRPTPRESSIANLAEVKLTKAAQDSSKMLLEFILRLDLMDRDSGVIFMGATNFPQALDAALMRPGRLDRSLEFKRPNVRERLALLDFLGVNPMRMDVPVGYFLGRTQGLSQSDLATMMNEARLEAVYTEATFGIDILELVYERVKAPHMIRERYERLTYSQLKENPHWIFHNVFHEIGQAIVHTFLPAHAPIFFLTRGKNPTPNVILPLSDRPIAYAGRFIEAAIQGYLAGQAGQFIGLVSRRDPAGLPSSFLKHYNLRLTAEDIECATVLAYFLALRSGIYSNYLDVMNQLRYDTNSYLDGKLVSPKVALLIEEAWAPWRETWGYLDLDEDLFHRAYPHKVERWVSVHPITGQPIGNQVVESYQWVEWCYSRSSIAADARRMDHINPLSGTRDSKWKDVLSYSTSLAFRLEGNHGASTNQIFRIYSDVYITTLLRLGYEGASSLIQEHLELFDYLAMLLLLRGKMRSFELIEFIEDFGATPPDKSLLYNRPNIQPTHMVRSVDTRPGLDSDLTFRPKTVDLEPFSYNTFARYGRELFKQYREKEFAHIQLSDVQIRHLESLVKDFEKDQVLCLTSQENGESSRRPSPITIEITDLYLEAARLQLAKEIKTLDEKLADVGHVFVQIEQLNLKEIVPEFVLLKCIWHEWAKVLQNFQKDLDNTGSLKSGTIELSNTMNPDTLKSVFLTDETFKLIPELRDSLERLREFYQLQTYEDNDIRHSLATTIEKFPNQAVREDFHLSLLREWKFKSQNRIILDPRVFSSFLNNFEEPHNQFWSSFAAKNGPFEICEEYAIQAGLSTSKWYEVCEEILMIQSNVRNLLTMWFFAHFGALQLQRDCLNHWQELNQYDHPTIFTDFFHTPRRGDPDYQPPS